MAGVFTRECSNHTQCGLYVFLHDAHVQYKPMSSTCLLSCMQLQPVIDDPSRLHRFAASLDTHGDLGFIRQIDLQSMDHHGEIDSRLRPVTVYNLLEVA